MHPQSQQQLSECLASIPLSSWILLYDHRSTLLNFPLSRNSARILSRKSSFFFCQNPTFLLKAYLEFFIPIFIIDRHISCVFENSKFIFQSQFIVNLQNLTLYKKIQKLFFIVFQFKSHILKNLVFFVKLQFFRLKPFFNHTDLPLLAFNLQLIQDYLYFLFYSLIYLKIFPLKHKFISMLFSCRYPHLCPKLQS